jgi:hypothetical protein
LRAPASRADPASNAASAAPSICKVISPLDLQARSASTTEREDRTAVDRISPDALASELREAIEAKPRVDRLDAKEHADA